MPDGHGLRPLTDIEQKRLFGFPDNFQLPIEKKLAHDLFGNTVPVPVVKAIGERLLAALNQIPLETAEKYTTIANKPRQTELFL